MNGYIKIGKFEFWISKSFDFEFNKVMCGSGCRAFHFTWIGFTILDGECR